MTGILAIKHALNLDWLYSNSQSYPNSQLEEGLLEKERQNSDVFEPEDRLLARAREAVKDIPENSRFASLLVRERRVIREIFERGVREKGPIYNEYRIRGFFFDLQIKQEKEGFVPNFLTYPLLGRGYKADKAIRRYNNEYAPSDGKQSETLKKPVSIMHDKPISQTEMRCCMWPSGIGITTGVLTCLATKGALVPSLIGLSVGVAGVALGSIGTYCVKMCYAEGLEEKAREAIKDFTDDFTEAVDFCDKDKPDLQMFLEKNIEVLTPKILEASNAEERIELAREKELNELALARIAVMVKHFRSLTSSLFYKKPSADSERTGSQMPQGGPSKTVPYSLEMSRRVDVSVSEEGEV